MGSLGPVLQVPAEDRRANSVLVTVSEPVLLQQLDLSVVLGRQGDTDVFRLERRVDDNRPQIRGRMVRLPEIRYRAGFEPATSGL